MLRAEANGLHYDTFNNYRYVPTNDTKKSVIFDKNCKYEFKTVYFFHWKFENLNTTNESSFLCFSDFLDALLSEWSQANRD